MNSHLSTVNYLEYPVFTGKLDLLITKDKALVNTINQYSYCIAEEDSEFKEALQNSDVLLPDGIGIVVAEKFLTGRKITKISGAELHQYLLEWLKSNNGSCFYLGSSVSTLVKIKERMSIDYPAIKVGYYSPPFQPSFSDTDNRLMIEAVNAFNPDVLFVGMTAPKQEKWAYTHKAKLNTKLICSIGAVFDFYAGTVKRPSKIWVDLGLEWLGRLVKEPKRMWRRYLYYGFVFCILMLKKKFRLS